MSRRRTLFIISIAAVFGTAGRSLFFKSGMGGQPRDTVFPDSPVQEGTSFQPPEERAKRESAPPPFSAEANKTDGVFKISELKPAGNRTAQDALRTLLWAQAHLDLRTIRNLVAFDRDGRADALAFFSKLPPETQAKFGSPEGLLAALLADSQVAAYAKIDEVKTSGDDQTTFSLVGLNESNGAIASPPLTFLRNADGWRLVYPGVQLKILASIAAPGLVKLR